MIGIAALGLGFLAWERLAPARPLPAVAGWWPRVLVANLVQLAFVLAVGPLTQAVLAPLLPLSGLPDPAAGAVAWLASTFLWYWWHRARHEVRPLWLGFHQLHHSPSRIEVAMAFYKHPLELLANALLSAAVAGPLFGLAPGAAVAYATLAAFAELVYHANVRTPRWLGFFLQRPEMHRLHHARGHHAQNYADLPVWDWLFGTYANPETCEGPCGLDGEAHLGRMLLAQDADRPVSPRAVGLALLTGLGLASVAGTLIAPMAPRLGAAVAGVGRISLVSPFPKVFCAVGDTEPWTWRHVLTLTWADGRTAVVPLDRAAARRAPGPYAYRNATGAAVAYGPWLPEDTVRAALTWTACADPDLLPTLGLPATPRPVRVRVDSAPPPSIPGAPRAVEVRCPS